MRFDCRAPHAVAPLITRPVVRHGLWMFRINPNFARTRSRVSSRRWRMVELKSVQSPSDTSTPIRRALSRHARGARCSVGPLAGECIRRLLVRACVHVPRSATGGTAPAAAAELPAGGACLQAKEWGIHHARLIIGDLALCQGAARAHNGLANSVDPFLLLLGRVSHEVHGRLLRR